ncbi:MAG: tyrosine-type recombinase/integrase [[Clostridium] scindens]
MMEQKIMEVLRRMQAILDEACLRDLKTVLQVVFEGARSRRRSGNCGFQTGGWAIDLEEYLMSKALEGKSPGTVDRYRYELQRLLSYVNKAVRDITEGDISGYMRAYKAIRQVSNQTLKNVRAVYSRLLRMAAGQGPDPEESYGPGRGDQGGAEDPQAIHGRREEMLLRNCSTLRDKAMMEFFYSTAVRVSELAALNRDDIRFTSKDLIVFGKGSKERRVYLNDRTNLYMKEYLDSRTDGSPALFVSIRRPHSRLSKTGIEDIIRRTGQRAGVEKAHPHRFRRTSLTNALNRECRCRRPWSWRAMRSRRRRWATARWTRKASSIIIRSI